MKPAFTGYRRRDWRIAALLVIALLILGATQLTRGMPRWGDDFAAYLSEGIAISNGTLDEQILKNYRMHPSPFSAEAEESGLVYVWGFPLLLSLVHRLAGFDILHYGSILFYKLPSLIAFALLGGVLFLFYRRFFSSAVSAFLTLIFALNPSLLQSVDHLNVDIVFLFWGILALLLAEAFLDSAAASAAQVRSVSLAIGLGIAMWFTYETRLNGLTLLAVIGLSHALQLWGQKPRLTLRAICLHLLPYVVFLVFKLVSESILGQATPNTSDIGKLTLGGIKYNLYYYRELTIDYLISLTGGVNLFVWPVMCVLLAIGLVKNGFSRRTFPLAALLGGTYAVLILLPYEQGLRYLYPVLPLLLLFMAFGAKQVCKWLGRFIPAAHGPKILAVLCAVWIGFALWGVLPQSIANLQNGGLPGDGDVYSAEAIDMYHYIQAHVTDEETIAFVKPRALHLNTQKQTLRPHVNGHTLEEADYYLYTPVLENEDVVPLSETEQTLLEEVYQNRLFCLYRIQKAV